MGRKIIYCNINGLYLLEKVFKGADLHLHIGGNVQILRRVKDERGASAYRVSIAGGARLFPSLTLRLPLPLLKRGTYRPFFATNATRFRVQLQLDAAPIQA